ncbi:MAG TPA: winged helix-turn-helix domain-containing protein [Polyangiales bacterium]|nr:winged helix-turn-helix domain-containing protein [Polyangiales bacterium]
MSGDATCAASWDVAVILLWGNDEWMHERVCELRFRGVGTPLLGLRSTDDTAGACALLDQGIDGYLPENCANEELLAFVRALARRGPVHGATLDSDVTLMSSARTLRLRGRDFKFGPVAFSVVRYLVQNRDRWVSQREIVERAMGSHYRQESAVARVQIHQIRKLLGEQQSCIQQDGRRGCGYRFTMDAEQLDADDRDDSDDSERSGTMLRASSADLELI